ncbi:MAG: hypothetical protein IPM35_07735 [Myxococcales bacterium]|nr:hypothetical protein [Myxococcales bacterium]
MNWTQVTGVALLSTLLLACGGSTDSDGSSTGGTSAGGSGGASGGSGGSGGGGSGGGGGTGGYCESFVPCCDAQGNEVTPICPTPGNPECPPGSSWPKTGICEPPGDECTPAKACAADEWCDYPDNLCGAGVAGKCVKRPQGCDLLYAPVCTCDGKVAGNECAGQSGGWDVAAKGGCAPPQDMFACGQLFCMTGQQYCEVVTSDVGGYPDSFACKELPSACGSAPSCGCLKDQMCGDLCKTDAGGNFVLTCPGG